MFCIVLEEEEAQGDDVPEQALGEGECFAGEAGQELAQGEVDTFEMIGGTFLLLLVELFRRNNRAICLTPIGKAWAGLVRKRYLGPQLFTGVLRAVAPHPSHDLAGSSAKSHLDPATKSHLDPNAIGFTSSKAL